MAGTEVQNAKEPKTVSDTAKDSTEIERTKAELADA